MADLVIKNTRIMQTEPPFQVLEGVDIVIDGNTITKVGRDAAKGVAAKKVIDGTDKTVMPGNVCSHHHYYSGLSRGMLIQAGPQRDFIQVLKEWWWRLDRGLDEEACYYSSLICSLDAIMAGTTAAIDHHASPSYIAGSLDTIAKGMEKVGIRGSTCYEITDRNGGMAEVEAGVEESRRFIERSKKSSLVKAMIGGHAPFTIPNEGLKLMGDLVEKTKVGIHLHVAEDRYDVAHSHHRYGMDIVDRLDEYGLLTDNALLVHGLYLNEDEIRKINERGVFFAHNPRSNMNNHVGYCSHIQDVKNLLIGTDGCGGNMFEELKIGFFKHKDEGLSWWPPQYVEALNRGYRLVEKYFDGSFGRVEAGMVADLVITDYHNPTPLVQENAASHFIWGMSSNCVESVIVDGKVVMENRAFAHLDVDEIYREAAKVAKRVWKEVDTIAP
ncbi:MAG TPA: putative aminohydrolase SsnA [Sphaerochaeta sp.]|nr:putative aminohydrolase SsnA [Sphaerochaeta sp.]HPY44753.1 putative aminohydrolase SsnA [Sphaerochaeta sp.]HQB04699.1 putative aminohydrolase SsnA [Sphaerochaeta sp.]